MAHQTQLEKTKYRNWVKGGLSMKYLKDGLEKFTDDVVQTEHKRILQKIGHTPGLICCSCSLRDLKPVHQSVLGSTWKGRSCPFRQSNCNCLYPNKTSCPNKICDAIYEEILNAHASCPPSPYLQNTDITKWTTHQWEVAKCFINAPGYKDKQSVKDIDVAGLLHVFINNKVYQRSLSPVIVGNMCEARVLRNKIFHSPNLELEEQDLNECFKNSVTILEDWKNLKHNQCAKEAVELIKQLQNQDFIITTETEAMVLRYIIEQRIDKLEVSDIQLAKEHSQLKVGHTELGNRQSGLEQKHSELVEEHSQLKVGHTELENRQSGLEQKHSELTEEQSQLKVGHTELENSQSGLEQKHSELEKKQSQLEVGHTELKRSQSGLEQKHSELEKKQSQLEVGHTELKNSQSGLEHSHLELSKDLSQLQTRLVRVETDVDKLNDLYKNQLTIVERRLDARRKLSDYLEKHYVKTSASPLKTKQNEIDIDKVYVPPKIEIVKNESSENENKDSSNDKPTFVKTYSSIFHSHGKPLRRIYLLGEVGSGKSAFCKMMILNWCRSVTKQTDQPNCKNELENIETMKQFDFLFFLPLRRLQSNGRIRDMIHWYYKDLISVEILDDILLNVPEKCVILADGLDEWAPNPDEQRPLHVTDGLPYLEDIQEVTVLTTSRPSASGVLNMTFTESDQQLVVKGVQSMELMAENYVLLINHLKSDSKVILDHLYAMKNSQLEKSPLLLQQLVWMLGNGIKVGKCLSNIYSSLVNVALRWAEEKCSKKKIKSASSCHNSSELQLPKQLKKYDACRLNHNILFTLGKIAFRLLIPENYCDSQMSFGRGKLNDDGLDDDMIDTVLSIGLLTEDNCHDNIEHRTQFAFVHASFQEYFAALYIASHSQIDQNKVPDAQKSQARKRILERLFRGFGSVQNIVQLGVVLQMLCGLAPDIIHDVCENVYHIAYHDSPYSDLRNESFLKQSMSFNHDKYIRIAQNMQTLIASCILEYKCNGETNLPVSTLPMLDLSITSQNIDEYSGLLQCIIPQKVLHLSLCLSSGTLKRDFISFISDVVFQNLETIAINIEWWADDDFHFYTAALNQNLLKSLSVRKCKISLEIGSVWSNKHVFDLANLNQLELLQTTCYVENVDLTNIKEIIFHHTNISPVIQGGVAPNLRHLELVSFMLGRENTKLAKYISRNVSIEVLKLSDIHYSGLSDKSSALIDLSSHDNLQILEVVCCSDTGIISVNTTNLHTVITDRIDVLHAVRNAQKLNYLEICGTFSVICRSYLHVSYTKEMNEDVCSCSQLQTIKLRIVTIQDEALEMSCGMRNLRCISLDYVNISLPAWIQFVDSLLNLKQSVTVILQSGFFVGNFDKLVNHVTKNNKTFIVKTNLRDYHYFSFETLR